MRSLAVVAVAGLLMAAAPGPQGDLVLNCYVTQSGDLSVGQFVRHLVIFPTRGIVSISDGIGGAPPSFVGNGRLITLDATRVVFDFASPRSAGRTEIDLRTGALAYEGDRARVRGSCQRSEL